MTCWHSKGPRRVYSSLIEKVFIWSESLFNSLSFDTHIAYTLTLSKVAYGMEKGWPNCEEKRLFIWRAKRTKSPSAYEFLLLIGLPLIFIFISMPFHEGFDWSMIFELAWRRKGWMAHMKGCDFSWEGTRFEAESFCFQISSVFSNF